MKFLNNIITFFILLFFLAENGTAQNVFGPQGPNFIREIIKTGPENGSGPVVSYLQLISGTCIIGKSTINNETNFGRALIQWNIPDNVIPDNSTINSVQLYLTYTRNNHSFELDAQFSSLPLDIQTLNQSQNDQLWQLMSTTAIGAKSGINEVLDFISNNPNDDFNLAVKDALVNDRFVLGIRVSVPLNITDRTWTIQNTSITLRIEFTPPTQSVTVDQKLPDNSSIDSVGLYNFSQSSFNKFSAPQTFLWDVGSNKTLQGSQKLLSNQKYKHWEVNAQQDNNIINHKTFPITPTTSNLTSRFNPTQPSITVKNSLEGTTIIGGDIQFFDPWYIDFQDGAYGNNWRNRGMTEPNQFYSRSVGTNGWQPDFATIYQQGPYPYNGIFLDQDPSQTPTNYKVGMPTEQTINVNGQNRKFFPFKWQNDGNVTFQDEYERQTGVVFTSTEAIATAVLKGQLMSNDQNGVKNPSQRKMVRTDNGQYHIVYESMGTVFYTYSLTSDFYGEWSPDYDLAENTGQAKNPAIDYEGNEVKIVFEYYNPQQSSEAKIFAAIIGLYGNGTYTYEGSDEIASYSNSYFGNAKPVISYGQWEIFVAYRNGPTGAIKRITKFSDGTYWGSWSNEDDIPGTNSDCINPSITGFRQIANVAFVYIAYENFGAIYFKQAYRWTDNYGNPIWVYNDPINLSKGSGFNLN